MALTGIYLMFAQFGLHTINIKESWRLFMDFTKKEIETILSCIMTTLEWAPSNVSPDFYDTVNHIADKCQKALHKDCVQSKHKTYHVPEATTSLGSILSKLDI